MAELGEDAVLLNSRRTEGEARQFGDYEVVFGTNQSEEEAPDPDEIGDSPEDQFLTRELEAVGDRAPVWTPRQREISIAEPEKAPATDSIGGPGVIVVVGPGGSGKTSLLMKLAFILSVTRGNPTRLVQLGSDRIAPREPLRTFAGILDLPVTFTDSFATRDLEPASRTEYVLVDTPGFAPADADLLRQTAEVIRSAPACRTHFVLPAWWSTSEVSQVVSRFAPFHPKHLAVTRADEVAPSSTVRALAAACGLPLSLVSGNRQASAGFLDNTQFLRPSRAELAVSA